MSINSKKGSQMLARRRPALYVPDQEVIKLMRLPRPFLIHISGVPDSETPRVIQQGEYAVLEVPSKITVFVNDSQTHGTFVLTHGDIIEVKKNIFVYIDSGGKDLAGIQAEIKPRLHALKTKAPEQKSTPRPPSQVNKRKSKPFDRAAVKRVPIVRKTIIGRNPDKKGDQDVVALNHPQLSKSHAQISMKDGNVWLKDLESRTGTFVNGQKIKRPVQIKKDDSIGMGPYSMPLNQSEEKPPEIDIFARTGNAGIVAHNLDRIVGKNKKILNNVSLTIEPKRFVCLLGPSGSGKTTLLNALSARVPATTGDVYVDGVNLYRDFEMLKSEIALVPQNDLAHETLTPRETVRYTAKLRLPPDTSGKEIHDQVAAALKSVGLTFDSDSAKGKADKKGGKTAPAATKIQQLSGGQKKRVSLANETVCRPTLLFLDEVTSGLDEETDWKIMRLCRGLADEGITIICVTHTLVNVEEFCDQLVVLAPPGVLVFSGSPRDALSFFNVNKLGEIYRTLEKQEDEPVDPMEKALKWQKKYQALAPDPPEKKSEKDSNSSNKKEFKNTGIRWTEFIRQFIILSGRNIRLLFRDIRTLLIALTQSMMIAALLVLAFEDIDAQKQLSLLFLLGISAFWLGCNNASKEIVKERPIYLRERDVNLSVTAYLFSKAWVFGFLAVFQTILLTVIVQAFREVPGHNLAQILLIATASICGTALGMLISAGCATRDQANTVVPLALVPQIILGGAIVPVLPRSGELVAQICISQYWIYEGLKETLGEFEFVKLILPISVQLAHIAVFALLAFAIMFYRDRRG